MVLKSAIGNCEYVEFPNHQKHNHLDLWILSELQLLAETMNTAFEQYKLQDACKPMYAFLDTLNNWYIRRNRRRFW